VIDHFTPPASFLGYSSVRAAMTGVTEVGVQAFYAADFDVFLATKELRLTLLPVVSERQGCVVLFSGVLWCVML
jgi:hypothetical protein